ncbi:MAG: hypothetical protein K6G24_05070 [Lachnospiraceae bacterium]|nr:hypothetical protein [Lachnospiraceae bacterium]
MNEYLSKLLSLEKDIEKISKKQTIMKSVGILFVFAVFFCSFNPELAMKIAFVVSIIAIIVLFVLDSNLANKKHSLEVDIYLLELDQLKKDKNKDKESDETGEMNMPIDWMDSISKPEEKAVLPIIYYLVLIVLDVVLLIL